MRIQVSNPNSCPLKGRLHDSSVCNLTSTPCETWEGKYPHDCPLLDHVILVERSSFVPENVPENKQT